MEEKKTKKGLEVVLILIIGILIIAVCALTAFLIKKNEVVEVAGNNQVTNNNVSKINLIDNFNNVEDKLVIEWITLQLDMAGQKIFDLSYCYGGASKGRLMYHELPRSVIEIETNKVIKDLGTVMTLNENYNVENTDTESQVISILYVLFEDGTLGKITTEDIKNNNFNITQLSTFKDIEYLKTFNYAPEYNAGIFEMVLCGIEKDTGKVIKIDSSVCP